MTSPVEEIASPLRTLMVELRRQRAAVKEFPALARVAIAVELTPTLRALRSELDAWINMLKDSA